MRERKRVKIREKMEKEKQKKERKKMSENSFRARRLKRWRSKVFL